MISSSKSFTGTRFVRLCAGVACVLCLGTAQAGPFDDLTQTLKQGLADAAHKSLDSAIGSTTPSAAATSQGAPDPAGANQKSSGSPGAVPASVAGTPVDPTDPTCLVIRKESDGLTHIKNLQCVRDPYFLVPSNTVAGCAWHAMKKGVWVSPHSVICEGRPDKNHSCECTGKTLWKGS
jgi:hypothetical protein